MGSCRSLPVPDEEAQQVDLVGEGRCPTLCLND